MVLAYYLSAEPIVPAPLQVYMICFLVNDMSLEIGLTAMSLVYGTNLSFISETPTLTVPQTF